MANVKVVTHTTIILAWGVILACLHKDVTTATAKSTRLNTTIAKATATVDPRCTITLGTQKEKDQPSNADLPLRFHSARRSERETPMLERYETATEPIFQVSQLLRTSQRVTAGRKPRKLRKTAFQYCFDTRHGKFRQTRKTTSQHFEVSASHVLRQNPENPCRPTNPSPCPLGHRSQWKLHCGTIPSTAQHQTTKEEEPLRPTLT